MRFYRVVQLIPVKLNKRRLIRVPLSPRRFYAARFAFSRTFYSFPD